MVLASSCSSAARIALREALMRSATINTAVASPGHRMVRCHSLAVVAPVLLDRPGHRPDVLELAVVGDAVGTADHVAAALANFLDTILDLAFDLLGGAERERVVEVDIADDAYLAAVLLLDLVDVHGARLDRMQPGHAQLHQPVKDRQ